MAGRPLKVYLAARYSRRIEICAYAEVLKRYGIITPARWLEGNHQAQNEELFPGGAAELFADDDLDDLYQCKELFHFTQPPRTVPPSRGGDKVEFGIAIAHEMPITIIGPRETVFHCLTSHVWVPDFNALLDVLEKRGFRPQPDHGS